MIDDNQRSLLKTVVSTIASLAPRVLTDPLAVGSVSILAISLSALLDDPSIGDSPFLAIYGRLSQMPLDEDPCLVTLFGGCLSVCLLFSSYSTEEAVTLSSELYTMWQEHIDLLPN